MLPKIEVATLLLLRRPADLQAWAQKTGFRLLGIGVWGLAFRIRGASGLGYRSSGFWG